MIEIELQEIIADVLSKFGLKINIQEINVNRTKNPEHGDYATNIAFKVCKILQLSPLVMAQKIVSNLDSKIFDHVEIAKPGFINFFLKKDSIVNVIDEIIQQKYLYGHGGKKNFKVNIEFVSANPTGDLHVGHMRCAIYGDTLSRIMSFAGYDVVREYYVNDAGNQIQKLGESIYQRYLQLFHRDYHMPDDGYMGENIIEIAKYFQQHYDDKLLESNSHNLELIAHEGLKIELNNIQEDLKKIGVCFDVFSSEKELYQNGDVAKTLKLLQPYTYIQDDATFIKTTSFLDDKDRTIIKHDGSYTYFLPDIAYHYNKIDRNFDLLIDIFGADHHGYINRLKSSLMMRGCKAEKLQVLLVQFVRLIENHQEVKMSKRSGFSVTIKELCEQINIDVIRYFFLMRSNTSHLDFDLNIAKMQNDNNPVYYAMYAHARLNSVLEMAKNIINIDTNGNLLKEKLEIEILKMLQNFPNIIEMIAKTYKVHKITNYVHSLAVLVHSYYNQYRIIDKNNLELSAQRLGLIKAIKIVFCNALALMGIKAPDKMERKNE